MDQTHKPKKTKGYDSSGYGEQDENGIDLSLIRENLKLTPDERIRRHFKARAFVLEVRRAAIAAGLRDDTEIA